MRWRLTLIITASLLCSACLHNAPMVEAQLSHNTSVVPVSLSARAPASQSATHYLLDSGDRLRIFVYGQPNMSRTYVVDHDGKITVPLLGALKARGLTTYGLEGVLKQRLGSQYVRNPQVNVDIQQNRPFYILGEVRNAGQFPYVSGMTVQTAVAIAGGFSERANESRARLTRRVDGNVETMNVPSDFVIQAGDTIYIGERYF